MPRQLSPDEASLWRRSELELLLRGGYFVTALHSVSVIDLWNCTVRIGDTDIARAAFPV